MIRDICENKFRNKYIECDRKWRPQLDITYAHYGTESFANCASESNSSCPRQRSLEIAGRHCRRPGRCSMNSVVNLLKKDDPCSSKQPGRFLKVVYTCEKDKRYYYGHENHNFYGSGYRGWNISVIRSNSSSNAGPSAPGGPPTNPQFTNKQWSGVVCGLIVALVLFSIAFLLFKKRKKQNDFFGSSANLTLFTENWSAEHNDSSPNSKDAGNSGTNATIEDDLSLRNQKNKHLPGISSVNSHSTSKPYAVVTCSTDTQGNADFVLYHKNQIFESDGMTMTMREGFAEDINIEHNSHEIEKTSSPPYHQVAPNHDRNDGSTVSDTTVVNIHDGMI